MGDFLLPDSRVGWSPGSTLPSLAPNLSDLTTNDPSYPNFNIISTRLRLLRIRRRSDKSSIGPFVVTKRAYETLVVVVTDEAPNKEKVGS